MSCKGIALSSETMSMSLKGKIYSLIEPIYSPLRAAGQVVAALPDPILVWQMSKVGSTTIQKTLKRAGVGALHVHFIDPQSWSDATGWYRSHGETLPRHFYIGRLLRWWLRHTQHRVKVVTLMRDPIARHVSGMFQSHHVAGFPVGDASDALDTLRAQFVEGRPEKYAFTWFDREIKAVLGIDIYAHPFDREAGYTRITTPRADILVMTTERLSELIPTVLSDFVGESLRVHNARRRRDKMYACVKSNFTLPDKVVQRVYGNPRMQHFYTNEQIAHFMRRWTNIGHARRVL